MQKSLQVSLLILFSLSSCISTYDLDFPDGEKKAALNGLIMPDSIFSVKLSFTAPLNGDFKNFEMIDNAQVQLFENDRLIGNLESIKNGIYTLDYYPKPGMTYQVIADIPGYGMVSAADKIPELCEINACFEKDKSLTFSDINVKVAMKDIKDQTNFYWMYVSVLDYDRSIYPIDSSKVTETRSYSISSNTIGLDHFNADLDLGMYSFNDYIRFEDNNLNTSEI